MHDYENILKINLMKMKKNIKEFIIKILWIFIALYISFILSMFYDGFINKKPIEIWYEWWLYFYLMVSFFDTFIVVLIMFLFVNNITRIKISNTLLFILIFIINLTYLIFLDLFDLHNPFYNLLFYIIWFLIYWYLYKLLKK